MNTPYIKPKSKLTLWQLYKRMELNSSLNQNKHNNMLGKLLDMSRNISSTDKKI